MQALYAATQNSEIDFRIQAKNLKTVIAATDKLLYYNIYFLSRVLAYSLDDIENQKTKQLQENRNQIISAAIYQNELVERLISNEVFVNFIERYKISSLVDDDLVRTFYHQMVQDAQYVEFVKSEKQDSVACSKIITHIYKEILYNDENYNAIIEEIYPSWADEYTFLLRRMEEVLSDGTIEINEVEEKEANLFADQLFQITHDNDVEFSELIHPKLKGWDADRIAQIDMIVMKMCMAELLYFPNIPIKVSINEYIDISKLYSTPKSKDFVNGVIDKVKNELLAENKIKKHGRGLVNE